MVNNNEKLIFILEARTAQADKALIIPKATDFFRIIPSKDLDVTMKDESKIAASAD